MINVSMPLKSREELESEYDRTAPVYEKILADLSELIRKEIRQRKINVTVHHRVKSFSSWYAKLLREAASKKSEDFVSITDVMGIRIICPFMEEIHLVSSLLQAVFNVEEIDVKGEDYPYQYFGYESVHFLICIPDEYSRGIDLTYGMEFPSICEVQVRTILQEAWAEVEHELVYKSDFTPLDEPLKRKLAALNANLTLSDIMFQEIRDYQKSLHTELTKRRKGFYDCINSEGPLPAEQHREENQNGKRGAAGIHTSMETVDSLLLKGLLFHNDRKYPEAINIYTEILKRGIRKDIRTMIFIHRGMAYFSAGLEADALKDFNSVLELDPLNTKALYYRAVNARINGRYEEAFKDLAVCLELEPYNLEYLTARGETHFAAGDRKNAEADYRAVLKIDPDFKPAIRLIKGFEKE